MEYDICWRIQSRTSGTSPQKNVMRICAREISSASVLRELSFFRFFSRDHLEQKAQKKKRKTISSFRQFFSIRPASWLFSILFQSNLNFFAWWLLQKTSRSLWEAICHRAAWSNSQWERSMSLASCCLRFICDWSSWEDQLCVCVCVCVKERSLFETIRYHMIYLIICVLVAELGRRTRTALTQQLDRCIDGGEGEMKRIQLSSKSIAKNLKFSCDIMDWLERCFVLHFSMLAWCKLLLLTDKTPLISACSLCGYGVRARL